MNASWDQETDVVVVGYGYSGGVAAIVAHDRGARVLLLEKMEHPGRQFHSLRRVSSGSRTTWTRRSPT